MTRFTSCLICLMLIINSSCKNDSKSENEEKIQVDTTSSEFKNDRKAENIASANSVFGRIVVTKECSTFASLLISTELSKLFMDIAEVNTIFVPNNLSFERLNETEKIVLMHSDSINALKIMLQNHVVPGSYNSADLVQGVKDSNGELELRTLNGETMVVTKNGNDIVVALKNGSTATLGKSDIEGSNGFVHVLDEVLKKS